MCVCVREEESEEEKRFSFFPLFCHLQTDLRSRGRKKEGGWKKGSLIEFDRPFRISKKLFFISIDVCKKGKTFSISRIERKGEQKSDRMVDNVFLKR